MTRYHNRNGIRVAFTAEEEAARDAEEAQAAIEMQASIDAEETRKNKRKSGKQKLKDLGLDDAEIEALIGE